MDSDDSYDDANRAFLQAFLAQNSLTLESAKPILASIFSATEGRTVHSQDVSQDDLNSLISAANSALSPLDLEIRSTFHQTTRDRVYALVNTTSDSLTQLATTYTPDEIAYVKRLLDAMFDGQNNRGKREAMCLSSIEAVQLAKGTNRRETQNGATQGTGLTMRDGEDVLRRLLNEGWLEKSAKNFYSLSPRALMELKGWLVETYNDVVDEEDEDTASVNKIRFCHACKDIITIGQRCSNHECTCRLHNNCTQNLFRIQRSRNCPLCQTEWDGKNYVGEKAITTSEAYLKGKRRSANQPPSTSNEETELANEI